MVFLFCLGLHSIIAMDKRILHGKQVTNFGRFFLETIFIEIDNQWFSPTEKEWGFMVSLQHMYYSTVYVRFCSGSIISLHFVMTAGHCVRTKEKEKIAVVSNSKYNQVGKSPLQNIHLVKEIMIHPYYVSTWKILILML